MVWIVPKNTHDIAMMDAVDAFRTTDPQRENRIEIIVLEKR